LKRKKKKKGGKRFLPLADVKTKEERGKRSSLEGERKEPITRVFPMRSAEKRKEGSA